MFHTLTVPTSKACLKNLGKKAFSEILQLPRRIFISGPRVLLTSRITVKCAVLMTLLLAPSLVCSLFLSLPSVLFQSPDQNAYYYFAKVLDHDPSRWLPMALAVLCMFFALAMPSSMPRQRFTVGY